MRHLEFSTFAVAMGFLDDCWNMDQVGHFLLIVICLAQSRVGILVAGSQASQQPCLTAQEQVFAGPPLDDRSVDIISFWSAFCL